jgi:hypothetical protein
LRGTDQHAAASLSTKVICSPRVVEAHEAHHRCLARELRIDRRRVACLEPVGFESDLENTLRLARSFEYEIVASLSTKVICSPRVVVAHEAHHRRIDSTASRLLRNRRFATGRRAGFEYEHEYEYEYE